MKVLLLGANGQLGTDLQTAAADHDSDAVQLIPLTRKDIDVSDPARIEKMLADHAFEALVNCTSYHKTDEVESHADQAVAINAHAVAALARACAAKKARLVHVSTDYVFDGLADKPYVETDPVGPLNVYGATKAMGESLIRLHHDDHLIFRVASLFGVAGASGKGGNFVETMIKVGRDKGALRVIADQYMSPTATADVARMILKSLIQQIPAGTYHAVNSGQASWYEFAARIIERAGVEATVDPIPASEYPQPAQRPPFSVMDNTKLAEQVGPIAEWTDALDRYLQAKGHMAGASTN